MYLSMSKLKVQIQGFSLRSAVRPGWNGPCEPDSRRPKRLGISIWNAERRRIASMSIPPEQTPLLSSHPKSRETVPPPRLSLTLKERLDSQASSFLFLAPNTATFTKATTVFPTQHPVLAVVAGPQNLWERLENRARRRALARTFRERPRAERAMQGGGSEISIPFAVYHRC